MANGDVKKVNPASLSDDTQSGLSASFNEDVSEGYHIVEETDSATKAVTYDVLCDGKLIWSTVTKPLAMAFIAGHKSPNRSSDKGDGANSEDKSSKNGGKRNDPSKVEPGSQSPTPDGDPTAANASSAPTPRKRVLLWQS
jgi:hypothetical protein